MISAIWWGGLAAASLLIGYLLAIRGLSNRMTGLIMGIGSGALISAIAYELIPESVFESAGMALAFLAGAFAFFAGDWLVDHRGGGERKAISGEESGISREGAGVSGGGSSGAAIFIGTLLDNIPESLILGIGLANGGGINIAFLSAVFISNLPEGVAGSINLEAVGYSRRTIFWMWVSLVLVSAVSAGLGYFFINQVPILEGLHAQAFAAGAMLTMLADAMMPEAFEHGGKMVGLFTVMGFLAAAILSIVQ